MVEAAHLESHADAQEPTRASAAGSRGPSPARLHGQGQLALARMSADEQPVSILAFRTLHTRLFIDAKAEYDGALELEARRQESPVSTTIVEAGATLRSHLPRLLGGRETASSSDTLASDDHRGWSHVFALLADLRGAIDRGLAHDAVELLRRSAEALAVEKRRTRATLDRMDSGTDAAIAGLELIIAACVTVASAGVGAQAAASGATLLKVAGISAATAAAASATFTSAKVASERVEGLTDDGWLSAVLDGAESGVTTLVFAVVGGRLAARFVPKLARYLGARVSEAFLARVGQLLHLAGPIPRDFFVTSGSRVLWDFLSGSASSILAAPIHLVFEAMRGHHVTVHAFLDGVAQEIVAGGAFQLLMGALVNHIVRLPVDGHRAPDATTPVETRFQELLGNAGLQYPEAALRRQLDLYRRDPSLAPMMDGVSDEAVMAVIGYTGPDHEVLNVALRTGDKQLLATLRPYIELARQGLSAMPVHRGTVWRGVGTMTPRSLARYQPGATVTDEGFMSTSNREDNMFIGKVQMEVISKTARDVSKVSLHSVEKEVLFPPGTRFRVLEREDQLGCTRLKLEEEVRS